MESINKLKEISSFLKNTFVGKGEIIDLLVISLVARENAFLLGPPGTAKSAIVKALADCIGGGKNFEYLLTRFTEPNEIFGPFDIRKLKEGELVTNTEGMLPEASMVFLDEIFNANSAILNSLLMALNERTFRRGKESRQLPVLMFVGASNLLPEDETLNALLDRFLIRIKCDYVDPDSLHEVLLAGWELERSGLKNHSIIPADEVRQVQQAARRVDLNAVRKPFVGLVHGLRNAGIKVSDRRAVKIQNLIAASAFVCGRSEATLSDLWVLKYIWDTEEQIEIIAGMVDRVIEKEPQETAHAQAFANRIPNAEELAKEVSHLKARWQTNALTLEEQNILKDKLRYVQTRSSWVRNQEHKQHIQTEIDALWHSMLQSL